jgi:hypothetical protein
VAVKLLRREPNRSYLLIPAYIEERQVQLLCKYLVKFVNRKDYWPSVTEFSKMFHKDRAWTRSACAYYFRLAVEQGFLEKFNNHFYRFTPQWYEQENIEPIEPRWPSGAKARAKLKQFHTTLKREHERLKELGLINGPESV